MHSYNPILGAGCHNCIRKFPLIFKRPNEFFGRTDLFSSNIFVASWCLPYFCFSIIEETIGSYIFVFSFALEACLSLPFFFITRSRSLTPLYLRAHTPSPKLRPGRDGLPLFGTVQLGSFFLSLKKRKWQIWSDEHQS